MSARERRKKAGKTEWAGRRRPMTRTSGFSAQAAVELDTALTPTWELDDGGELTIEFSLPRSLVPGTRVGFGGWFFATGRVEISITPLPERVVTTTFPAPDWNKLGNQWLADEDTEGLVVRVGLRAESEAEVSLYELGCGVIEHAYLEDARPALLPNMWMFAPEANIYAETGDIAITPNSGAKPATVETEIHLKSCNRCGRFLPVNLANERNHLSFTNHCVATHRRPCGHSGFGRITHKASGTPQKLEYGFQLECRFCKKFEVNAAHNPQRSTAQMKEDAQRRRSFELLLEHLYEGSDQLRYRTRKGSELSDDIMEKFGGKCFRCQTLFSTAGAMHLDHTRPLALLWPLDETGTALCASCNSAKRDRAPGEYYTRSELERLSGITGLSIDELEDPSPNREALQLLFDRRDWFTEHFLALPELTEVRDGKRASDLLLKALNKALNRAPGGPPFTMRQLLVKIRLSSEP